MKNRDVLLLLSLVVIVIGTLCAFGRVSGELAVSSLAGVLAMISRSVLGDEANKSA